MSALSWSNRTTALFGAQVTTASGICAVLDLLATGTLPTRGFVRQEDVALKAFLQIRFGKIYSIEENADANAHADPHADQ
jgi:saccharopine dehydrogenase-like NADP-dependent oxidoreductase